MASSSPDSSAIYSQQKYKFPKKYDVFLSFRGEDTRDTFATYLYGALSANQILTFMDHKVEIGDEISPTLCKAIEESKIWVIIFSKNFASSTWCLDELVHILECKKRNKQSSIMPIFYGIDPSVVRKQEGSYKVAFDAHGKRFKDRMEKVHEWRAALTETSNICGLDAKNFSPEVKLVQKIVEDISLKLRKYQPSNEHYKGWLVGIEKNIKEINSLLSIDSIDVRIIGIWGMGGIGKTTLASVVYQRLSYSQFEGCSFLSNVREEYARCGPNHLRKKLLSELLNDKAILMMGTPFVASPCIFNRLRHKKVLMVLDDVDNWTQLEALVEGYDQLAPGSRIIVTSRNVQVLKKVANRNIHKVERLGHIESLELFCLHAFGKNSPPIDDEMLLNKVAMYADGNPLALKVLGSFLNSKSKEKWENALNKFKKFPDKNILNVLATSYEGLDKGTQNIFLDIACLFNGPFIRDHVESLLDDGNSWVKVGISDLIEKSLIDYDRYSEGNELRMHDLLQQMGQKIICDGHTEPGHRSRIWDAKEIRHVLERNTGTIAVEIISFNMSEMTRDVKVCRAAFSKMCNLRILKIYCDDNIGDSKVKLHLLKGLDSYLSDKLNYFHWDLYPLESLPSNFTPENLVELILRGSHVQKLWNHEVQSLPVLRRMDLSYSKLLRQIPHLSHLAPNLESINLESCTSLVQVFPCLENLHKLTYLNLNGCSRLREFKEISRSGWYLDLVKCGGIKNFLSKICQQKLTFLKSFGNNILSLSSPGVHICQKFPMNLTVLRLSGTPIEAVPLSIGSLFGLVQFDLRDCERLRSLPTSICKLKSLQSLDLSGCVKLETFPEILEPMEHLKSLVISGGGIKELPESIENLISIESLNLYSCREIEFLPNKLCNLRELRYLWLGFCSKLQKLPPLPPALISLEVQRCESLKSLDLPLFCTDVNARHCTSLEKVSDWRPALQHQLYSDFSKSLEKISEIAQWRKYQTFYTMSKRFANFFGCHKLNQDTCNTIIADYAIFKVLRPGNLEVEFCYPGNQIPKWFSNQTSGTSQKIMLPPFWNNDNFLGLALCVVGCLKKIKPYADVEINCILKAIGDDSPYEFYENPLFWANNECSDHVLMWYVPTWNMSKPNWPSRCSIEASLHVWPSFFDSNVKKHVNLGSEYFEIKKWGVWFVNKEDVEKFNAETIQSKRKRQDFDNECSNASGSDQFLSSRSHEEEDDNESHLTIHLKKFKQTSGF
nr:disease resistance-like protein DSC1 [Ziziphus jujuba var. spinosa]